VLVRAWRDSVDRARQAAKSDSTLGRALRLWGSGDDALLLHVSLHAWRTDVARCRSGELKRLNATLEKAMLIMGSGDATVELHLVLNSWREVVRLERRCADHASRQARLRRCLAKALVMWSSGDQAEQLRFVLHEWHRSSAQQQVPISDSAHDASLDRAFRSALLVLASSNASAELHVVLCAWCDWLAQQRKLLLERMVTRAARLERTTDKALLVWGGDIDEVAVGVCLRSWSECVGSKRQRLRREARV